MRLTVVFSYLVVFQLYAGVTYSQNMKTVSLFLSNVTVEEAINTIEKETSYSFLFTDETVDIGRKVNIHVDNGDITDILSQLLRSTDVGYQMINNQIILAKSKTLVFQQEGKNTVTGTVVDINNEPVIGANVIEKGTTNGIVTDADGNFSLNVADNAVLKVSYIGYITQEISDLSSLVRGSKPLIIRLLEDTQTLEEVVVVGYGTQKKVNLTGAVAQVKGEVLENRSVTTVSQALQGQVANLNITTTANGGRPDATQTINIRGYTGFGSTGSPLVVIDGIQGGDINSVNMNDVESISVLKDAASAAIYGSSAPYGVILITTKRGKAEQKPTITYNSNFGWAQPVNLPKAMNSLDFANYFNEACDNAGIAHTISDWQMQRIKDYNDGKLTEETAPDIGFPSFWNGGNANNDWYDLVLKDFAFSQQQNVGVSGSVSHSSYYAGLGYTQKDGLLNGFGDDSYRRYNVRANLSSEISKWLSFNLRSAFSRASAVNPNYSYENGPFEMLQRMWPFMAYTMPTGEKTGWVRAIELGGRDRSTNDNAILTGEFVFHPLAGWDITANYTFDGIYRNSTSHRATVYQTMPNGDPSVLTNNPNSFSRSTGKNQHYIINAFTSYEKQLKDHYFKAMVGYTQELYDNVSFSAGNNQLYSDELPSLALSYGTLRNIGESASQLAIRGGFGRINYNYREKYLLELNGRYDGTSRFLKDVRYKFYPGISAGWIASKESFWKPIESAVNSLKIRVEYGQLGDQSFTGNYPFYPSLNTVNPTSTEHYFGGSRESYISNPGIVNSSLTWITTTSLDFGADLTFLSNRLDVSFDWYRRSMDDYVGPAQLLPAVLGSSAPQTNSTAVETKGWELTVGFRDRKGDLSYGINAVLSDYQGIVKKYPNPEGLNTTWYEGQKMGAIWGYETAGLFQSDEEIASAPSQNVFHSRWSRGDVRYKDLNNDGKIDWGSNTLEDPGDRKVIGNNTPRYSFGVNMNAEYKGFDVTLFLQGVGKRDFWFGDSNMFWGIIGSTYHNSGYIQHYDRWSESNPDGYYPKYYFSGGEMSKNMQTQTRYLSNAAYLRVKNLQIGYSLPASLLKRINCQKLRFFVNVENLATLTKMIKSIDPELTYGRSDGKIYPLQRTWAGGLNITF
ncbi:MAG: TonB-dependent receptor [Bacteroidales bacterium]|nr:TonB-dependent receptor [Bacteroidales bacterium]